MEKPDLDNEKEKYKRKGNISSYHLLFAGFIICFTLIILSFLVMNLPGRYKAVVINDRVPDDVLVLDTVKGNIWRYQFTRDVSVITYLGKLNTGEKIAEPIVLKLREVK